MNTAQFAKLIEYNTLGSIMDHNAWLRVFEVAKTYRFRSLVVTSNHVRHAKDELGDSGVRVNAVIAYPNGEMTIREKLFSAKVALDNGADEISYVMNLSVIKSKDYLIAEEELIRMLGLCQNYHVDLNVYVATDVLTKDELAKVSRIVKKYLPSGIVLTSLSNYATSIEDDVTMMRMMLNKDVKIKVDVDTDNFSDIMALAKLGASRFALKLPDLVINDFMCNYGK